MIGRDDDDDDDDGSDEEEDNDIDCSDDIGEVYEVYHLYD
jgi:hypothetical protein